MENNTEQLNTKTIDISEEQKPSFPPIASIADAENRMELVGNSDIAEFILQSIEDDDRNPEGRSIFGSADEYHNLASEYARRRLYNGAESVAAFGAALYKFNVDLLADIVKYGSQAQDWDNCRKAYDRLQEIEKKKWNWRTFTFAIDYLISLLDVSDMATSVNLGKEITNLVKDFKKLNDERAWLAEADYLLYTGDRKKAIIALKDAIAKVKVVPSVCLKLADLLLEDGEYDDVIETAAKGIRSSAQDQPSVNTGYLVYISALAKDAIIHNEALQYGGDPNRGFNNLSMVEAALTDYEIAERLLNRRVYLDNIRQRVLILSFKSGLNKGRSNTDD